MLMLFGAAGAGAQNQAETAMLSLASGSSAEGHITLSWQLPSGLAEGVLLSRHFSSSTTQCDYASDLMPQNSRYSKV